MWRFAHDTNALRVVLVFDGPIGQVFLDFHAFFIGSRWRLHCLRNRHDLVLLADLVRHVFRSPLLANLGFCRKYHTQCWSVFAVQPATVMANDFPVFIFIHVFTKVKDSTIVVLCEVIESDFDKLTILVRSIFEDQSLDYLLADLKSLMCLRLCSPFNTKASAASSVLVSTSLPSSVITRSRMFPSLPLIPAS